MFDVSWGELMLTGVVALVVIGPKDLPRVMRTCGQWLRKARAMAADFQGQMALIDRELEMEELREQIRRMRDPELEKQIEAVMTQERRVRPPAPVDVGQWAGAGSGVSEDELLPADLDELRALDEARATGASAAAGMVPPVEAEIESDATALYIGADDFLAEDAGATAGPPPAKPAEVAAAGMPSVRARPETDAAALHPGADDFLAEDDGATAGPPLVRTDAAAAGSPAAAKPKQTAAGAPAVAKPKEAAASGAGDTA